MTGDAGTAIARRLGQRTRALVALFDEIRRTRMLGLPIANPALRVEAVGFEQWEDQDLGILITPWFMNLVLLPDSGRLTDLPQGDRVECRFPSGPCELTVYHDEDLGSYLAAVLFRTVADFPDQDVARAVAEEALAQLLAEPAEKKGEKVSRRGLFTGLKAS